VIIIIAPAFILGLVFVAIAALVRRPRPSLPSFSRVACPHYCTCPCPRSSSLPSSPSPLASSPWTSCRHLHPSHLGCCHCAVTVVVVSLPSSSSPCRIRLRCRCRCLCPRHCHRRVVALVVVNTIIPVPSLPSSSPSSVLSSFSPPSPSAVAPFPCFLFALRWRWLPTLC
jgi:hypothetical protein